MKNIKGKKLYMQVYDEVRGYIVKHNLSPGDRLPTEMALAEALGVSRNVLREAMKALEIIGAVTSKPGVGMVVNTFNSNFLSNAMFLNLIGDNKELVSQSQEVRKVLELGFARKSFDSLNEEDIESLQRVVTQMGTMDSANEDYYSLDMEFHSTLYSKIGNHVLSAFVDSAWECEKHYESIFAKNKDVNVKKHQMIVDALRDNNFPQFMESMEYHFNHNYKEKIPLNSLKK